MNSDQAASYDEIPYPSLPYKMCHPRPLGVIAALAGLSPALAENCRLLEMGCASGGNLLPIAQVYPQSKFIGVDIGSRHIADGTALAQAAHINNVELVCRDICEFEPEGPFDYIIAHGLYSWVPEPVRNRLLELIGRHLAPNGVAFVSHMVYPGAYVWESLRHAMELATRGLSGEKRALTARKTVAAIMEISPKLAPRWGPLLVKWANDMAKHNDATLLHDQLAEAYYPVFLTDFAEHGTQNGLRYIGDTSHDQWQRRAELRPYAERLSPDSLVRSQMIDIAGFRMYRQSIFCRSDAALAEVDPVKLIQTMHLSSDTLSVPATTAVKQTPLSEFVLKALSRRWPLTMSFTELAQEMRSHLPNAATESLAQCILEMYETDRMELWLSKPSYLADASDPRRVRVTPLARAQAASGKMVVNLRQQSFAGDEPLARRIISQLDGTPPSDEVMPHLPMLAHHSMLTP